MISLISPFEILTAGEVQAKFDLVVLPETNHNIIKSYIYKSMRDYNQKQKYLTVMYSRSIHIFYTSTDEFLYY